VLVRPPGDATEVETFIVGYAIDRDRADVADAMRTLVLVSLVGLLLAGAGAYLVSGQILAPMRLVRQTAAEINEQDLTRRIPVQGRDDISALAEQFNAMLDRLSTAFSAQRQFVDDASHELRTPITIVRGHLELMGDDPAERVGVVRLVTEELDRMSRIVDDLLLLAKSPRPDFVRYEQVSVPELTIDVHAKVRALGERCWMLEAVGEGITELDPQRITQAMVAMAHNAVQHTAPDAVIRVGSALRRDRSGRWVASFWITDSGPGVRPEDTETIFERFSRGKRGSGGHRSGAGLGLAIVRDRRGASRHGTAGVETGPRSHLRHRTAGRSARGEEASVNRILIAEDEERIAAFVEKGLHANGFIPTVITDGDTALDTALDMARSGGFELVVLDLGLPGRDGFTVLRLLREARVRTPVIILTARDTVSDTVAGLEGGADDYMTKPFRFEELLARVRLRLRGGESTPEVTVLVTGGLSLDLRTRRAKVGERTVDLTAREFVLLELFLRHPGQVLSREQILSHVWGYDFDPGSNIVDVYVRALRRKLGAERIGTVRGMGYRLS